MRHYPMIVLITLITTLVGCNSQPSAPKPATSTAFLTIDEILQSPEYDGWTIVRKPDIAGPYQSKIRVQTDRPGEPLRGKFSPDTPEEREFNHPGVEGSSRFQELILMPPEEREFNHPGVEGRHLIAVVLETKDSKLTFMILQSKKTDSVPETEDQENSTPSTENQ